MLSFDRLDISSADGAAAALEEKLPRSLTAAVFDRLRADILTCRLQPGDKLPVVSLAERFGVSLSAVREALSRLVADGLVLAEDQRGFRVSPVSLDDLRDLTRTRIQIEGLALRQAIENGDEHWAAGVAQALREQARIPYVDQDQPSRHNEAWAQSHKRFHYALVSGCGSPWLLRFRNVLYEQTERYRRLALPLNTTVRDVGAEHRKLAEAAIARDADAAVAALTAHFELTTRILLDAYATVETVGISPPQADKPIPKRRARERQSIA
ncbi:MAG TPA: GntR family transcriptional regulator [Stellaceae bacterium]